MIVLLAGPTGVGKTEVLRTLHARGNRALDLEQLAHHRGSVFGAMRAPQPRPATFARAVRTALLDLESGSSPVWLEDEGPFLGRAGLPTELYTRFSTAPIVELHAPLSARIARIVATYGSLDHASLAAGLDRLAPRLGTARTSRAHAALAARDISSLVSILLSYYDAGYARRTTGWSRPVLGRVDTTAPDPRLVLRRAADPRGMIRSQYGYNRVGRREHVR